MNRRPGLRLSLRVFGGWLGAHWERERRDMLFLMAAVLIAVLPHLRWLPWWVGAGFLVLFGWRLGLLFSGRWLPRASVRLAAAIAATAAVWAQYDGLLGRDPGIALLVLFLGLKLMEMRANRDLLVTVALALFLLLAAFLHSQSIGVAVVVLTGLVGLLAALLGTQYHHREPPVGRRLRSAASLMLQAAPLAAILFVLIPRPAGPLWGAPGESDRARTGLSGTMSAGHIAELAESREIAFRVRFEHSPPAPAVLYWRGPTFGEFDGTTWRSLQRPATPLPPPALQVDAAHSTAYTVIQEASGHAWLFALEMPSRVDMPAGVAARLASDFQLLAPAPIGSRLRFEAVSSTRWRAGLNETGASLANWLALPQGFNPRTLALARAWREEQRDRRRKPREAQEPGGGEAQRDSHATFVERALAMLREQPFRYTLRPPPVGEHGVDDFLFETRAGFCEHYAAAFVVLMRALEVPARVVTGYQGGEPNPVDGSWLVRQADAHAWAEVWLAGRGWVRIDPTAAVAPERIERGVRLAPRPAIVPGLGLAGPLLERLRLRIDALAGAWNEWVLSYDRVRQQRLLARFGLEIDDWRSVAGTLALALTAALGAIAVLTLHPRRARDPVQRSWNEFCERVAGACAARRRPHETALGFLRRVEPLLDADGRAQARRIVSLYNRLRYADEPTDGGKEGAEAARRRRSEVRDLRRCVREFRP